MNRFLAFIRSNALWLSIWGIAQTMTLIWMSILISWTNEWSDNNNYVFERVFPHRVSAMQMFLGLDIVAVAYLILVFA